MPLPFPEEIWNHQLFDEEVTFNRVTHWTNGLVTTREVSCSVNNFKEFLGIQDRRVKNGPGIICARFEDKRGRTYLILEPKKK